MRTLPKEILIEIANRHRNSESLLQLSKEYGVSDVTLSRHLIRHGLKKKPVKKPHEIHRCPICSKRFSDYTSRKNRRCCSKECAAKYQSKYQIGQNASAYASIQKRCEVCSKPFMVMPCHTKTKTTCSKKCFKIHRSKTTSGKNNPNYKNGKTPEIVRLRYSQQYIDWRDAVYKRDNWTCQQCGQVGRSLHAHHILSFETYPAKRFDINNGITLCASCHQKLHRRLENAKKYA